jgi:methyl-accepting chemotaxis protein
MAWLNSLSIRSKLIAGCYLIAALFSGAFIVTVIVSGGSIGMAAIFIVILAAVTFPISRVIERALTSSLDDITSVALSISKGDFSSRVDVSATNAGELGHSFNSMIDKLREILNETTGITRHVSDASRSIFDKNRALKTVMEQVAVSSGELASGANAISEDVSGMTESIQEIEHKVADYAFSTKEMNMRSEHTLVLACRERPAGGGNPIGRDAPQC